MYFLILLKNPKIAYYIFIYIYVIVEKSGGAVSVEVQNERASSKPLKEKTSKAERRALQEAQRAAKAATKGKIFFK